jgi:hypothetical protein
MKKQSRIEVEVAKECFSFDVEPMKEDGAMGHGEAADGVVMSALSCGSDSEEEHEQTTSDLGVIKDRGVVVEMTTTRTAQCKEDEEESKIEVEEECRFCFEVGTPEDELVNPCKCRGTIGKVHRSCLRHWIFEKGCMNCEICNEPFELEEGDILSPEETLALRQTFGVQQRLGSLNNQEDTASPHFRFSSNNLRAFLLRHERLSRWINACILMAFSVIMLLVIVFLIYNWNTYYRKREDVFVVNEAHGGLPFESGIEVFTGFCDARRRMMCVVRQETLTNSTAFQRRLCDIDINSMHGDDSSHGQGKPCLRYSTYSIHKSCGLENDWCSLMLLPGVQDGECDALGMCEKLPAEDLSREEAHQFEAQTINGECLCAGV